LFDPWNAEYPFHQLILAKVTSKFEGAGQGLSQAQLSILQASAEALRPMYDEA